MSKACHILLVSHTKLRCQEHPTVGEKKTANNDSDGMSFSAKCLNMETGRARLVVVFGGALWLSHVLNVRAIYACRANSAESSPGKLIGKL